MGKYFDDSFGYKLRLFSKRLESGNYQITFHAKQENTLKQYGHVLVPQGSTLKDVVYTIKDELMKRNRTDQYHHAHLYSLGKSIQRDNSLVIFNK